MPVPTTIDQLSTTAGSNFPAGSDAPSSLDDVQRAHASFIAKLRDLVGLVTGTYVPATAIANMSLTPANLGAAPTASPTFTGTATIPAITGMTTPLSVGQGGTGSATQNFVDLTNSQTVAGVKTLSSAPTLSSGATYGSASLANPSGSAPMFTARAWCVFDGGLTGTNAPIVGGNVSSVTRTATGTYTVTFSSAMPDALFVPIVNARNLSVVVTAFPAPDVIRTTTTIQVITANLSGTLTDSSYVSLAVFR